MGVALTDKSNWEKKLATYALAGGAVMLVANEAGASPIVYSGPPISIGADETVDFDLDGGGVPDFQFQNAYAAIGTLKADRHLNLLVNTPGNFYVGDGTGPAALGGGVTIDGSNANFSNSPAFMAGVLKEGPDIFPGGNWFGKDAFLGLQFLIGTDPHFGWAHLSVTDSTDVFCATGIDCAATATLIDWAYESEVGAAITTPTAPVPEPASLTLLALGASGMAALRARRKRQQNKQAPTQAL